MLGLQADGSIVKSVNGSKVSKRGAGSGLLKALHKEKTKVAASLVENTSNGTER